MRGAWNTVPVTPALVRWRLTTSADKPVGPGRTVADFRTVLPEGGRAFWRIYAHGTFQSFPTIGFHLNYRQPGNYLFELTRTPLDTDRLPLGR